MVDRSRRLDLVSQERGLELRELQTKLVHTDLTRKEFDEHWDRLPIGERLFYALFVPLVLGYMLLVGPQRVLARHLQVDDLATRDEVLMAGGPFEKSDDLIVNRRDAAYSTWSLNSIKTTAATHGSLVLYTGRVTSAPLLGFSLETWATASSRLNGSRSSRLDFPT